MKTVRNDNGDVLGVELTRRNLTILLEKLDMPDSARTISQDIFITAVEDDVHYANRSPGAMLRKDGRIG